MSCGTAHERRRRRRYAAPPRCARDSPQPKEAERRDSKLSFPFARRTRSNRFPVALPGILLLVVCSLPAQQEGSEKRIKDSEELETASVSDKCAAAMTWLGAPPASARPSACTF